ncbi:MAG: hypothetical protein LBF69_02555 [Prevotellaceae bacterium]|jgi:hypothetical protein|nr:hypothetical protein [Prevotellaceae bacterium]
MKKIILTTLLIVAWLLSFSQTEKDIKDNINSVPVNYSDPCYIKYEQKISGINWENVSSKELLSIHDKVNEAIKEYRECLDNKSRTTNNRTSGYMVGTSTKTAVIVNTPAETHRPASQSRQPQSQTVDTNAPTQGMGNSKRPANNNKVGTYQGGVDRSRINANSARQAERRRQDNAKQQQQKDENLRKADAYAHATVDLKINDAISAVNNQDRGLSNPLEGLIADNANKQRNKDDNPQSQPEKIVVHRPVKIREVMQINTFNDKKEKMKELEFALIAELVKTDGFDTAGIDITKYNPDLYYCGSGVVSNPDERNWVERDGRVPQTANIACFIHDMQYLILDNPKLIADANFKQNTLIELKMRGVPDKLAEDVSNYYFWGVDLFADEAYRNAQAEAFFKWKQGEVEAQSIEEDLPPKQDPNTSYFIFPEYKEKGIQLANDLLPKAEEKLANFDENMELMDKNIVLRQKQLFDFAKEKALLDYESMIVMMDGSKIWYLREQYEPTLKEKFNMTDEELKIFKTEIYAKLSPDASINENHNLIFEGGSVFKEVDKPDDLLSVSNEYLHTTLIKKTELEAYDIRKKSLEEDISGLNKQLKDFYTNKENLINDKTAIQKTISYYSNVIQNGKIVVNSKNDIDAMNLGNILNDILNK